MNRISTLLRAGAALGLAACALAAHARDEQATTAADQVVVVRDAETGKFRAPTADEMAALKAKAQLRAGVRALAAGPATHALQKYHRSGATGVRLTEDMTSQVVAVKQPDGSLQFIETEPGDSTSATRHANEPVTE